jgi:LysR family cys regulon transcriptional activator
MAYDQEADRDLVALDATHLFEPSVTKVGFRWDMFITGYVADFIQMLSPLLTREAIEQAIARRRGGNSTEQSQLEQD